MAFGTLSENVRATDLQEGQLDPRVLAAPCVSWGVGPFRIEACLDLSIPEASISAYLLGVKIAECRIGSENCCKVGGSVGGFRAVATVCLKTNPLRITIDAQVCAPLVGCKKYHAEIPIPLAEDVEEDAPGGAMWV